MLKPKQKGALLMKWFNGINTVEELKKAYRKLAMKHHPDVGGDTATMQSINTEFDEAFERLSKAEANKHTSGAAHTSNTHHTNKASTTAGETAAQFRAIIEQLIQLDGVEIEIIGSWLWLTGNTYQHKDAIKALGFKWSKSKKSWYFHFEPYRKTSRKTFTMSELRDLYGSEYISKGDRLKLTVV